MSLDLVVKSKIIMQVMFASAILSLFQLKYHLIFLF